MRSWSATVREDRFVCGAGFFKCVSEDWHCADVMGLVHLRGKCNWSSRAPLWEDNSRGERVAEDVPEQIALMVFPLSL